MLQHTILDMSVTDRIDDARVLYSQGRRQGALLSVLIAVTATARTRFKPNTPSRTDPSKPMNRVNIGISMRLEMIT